jgi:murein L,D-transpeptidase YcbB/YkuD
MTHRNIASLHGASLLPFLFSVSLLAQQPSQIPLQTDVEAFPTAQAPTSEAGREIESLIVAGRSDSLRWPDFSDYVRHLQNFYGPMAWRPIWSANGRPTANARAVIALLEGADQKGIHASDYDGGRWEARLAAMNGAADETSVGSFDLSMTINLMRYISDLHIGRINPRRLRFALDIEGKKYYLPRLVADVATGSTAILSQIEPPYDEYNQLKIVYSLYRRLAEEGAHDQPLPRIRSLKKGESWAAIPSLAPRLRRVGDLSADVHIDPHSNVYIAPLVDAVKRFQARHGLSTDGVLGPGTLDQLNVPMSDRLRQIELALERWRWAPMGFDRPPIIVNLPEFVLYAWDENGRSALSMNVVVGQAYGHETPIFEGRMRYLVFRPFWNVTPNIQRKELVPKVEKNRSYLADNHYEAVDDYDAATGTTEVTDDVLARLRSVNLLIRQKPGPGNALGLVKFVLPNPNNIYLHSTPSQDLFASSRRDFSHGCIRVEDPVALAAWVLRDKPEWTSDKIVSAMQHGPDNQTVALSAPIPVYIVYSTVHVDAQGVVHFLPDLYGHDAELDEALAQGYPYPD